MSLTKLINYLDDHHIKYSKINHSPAFTAQEIAQAAHISGQEMVKTVIVKVDGKLEMVVVPAIEKIDLLALRKFLNADKVELASEYEFTSRFPECELGAMPAFGNLYDMPVLMGESLTHTEQIAFNAGTHTELIKLASRDFVKLVHPQLVDSL